MTRTINPAPVRREVVVDAAPARAFDVFVGSIARWWPKSHHIGAEEPELVKIEPFAGGRWFERDAKGRECDVGKVLAYEPPRRLVLAWQLTQEFKYDPDLVTEVEVKFSPAGAKTRVELVHSRLERLGEAGADLRGKVDAPNGWTAILALYQAYAAK